MQNYEIKVVQNDQEVGVGFSPGSNALEAFENAIENSSIYTPPEGIFEVHVLSPAGVCFKFDCGRVY